MFICIVCRCQEEGKAGHGDHHDGYKRPQEQMRDNVTDHRYSSSPLFRQMGSTYSLICPRLALIVVPQRQLLSMLASTQHLIISPCPPFHSTTMPTLCQTLGCSGHSWRLPKMHPSYSPPFPHNSIVNKGPPLNQLHRCHSLQNKCKVDW